MEVYKPLITKEELKKLCNQKRRLWDTPLEQGRRVMHTIDKLRRQKLYKYGPGEWEAQPENKIYMDIAKNYHRARQERIKARKEARAKQND